MHTLLSKDSEIIGLDSESFKLIVVFKSYFEQVLNIDNRKKTIKFQNFNPRKSKDLN